MKDISLVTLGMFAFGVSLWLCYGISIHAIPVIVWNATSLTLYVAQIVLKLTLGESDAETRPAARQQLSLAAASVEWTRA